MKIAIPDDYQDVVHKLPCYSLIAHHEVTRWREPAADLEQLVRRLEDADVVVSIRERVEFSKALLERLPKLKLLALVGRGAGTIDFKACTALGIPVSIGKSNSPDAPAELTVALIVASRRNIALEAERMKRGDWPCTLSHRMRGSTLGIYGLGFIGELVAKSMAGMGMNVLVWGQEKSLQNRMRTWQWRASRSLPPSRPPSAAVTPASATRSAPRSSRPSPSCGASTRPPARSGCASG